MERSVNARRCMPVSRGVVANELNFEVASGEHSLTLSDLVQFGVDVEASRAGHALTVVMVDGSTVDFRHGWWMPS